MILPYSLSMVNTLYTAEGKLKIYISIQSPLPTFPPSSASLYETTTLCKGWPKVLSVLLQGTLLNKKAPPFTLTR